MTEERTVPHQSAVLPVRLLRVSVVQGPDKGASIEAKRDRISVGSASDNDLVLADDTVSRYHLELLHLGGEIGVEDLGSTNGTRVANIRIERARVPGGTTLSLGKSAIRIEDGGLINVELHDDDRLFGLRGRTPQMLSLMASVQRAASSDVPVLILGETGAGKEIVADAIHRSSARAERPLEIVDCASLAPTLVASELFGHERGAFTGADHQHVGAFERADGGTLFLDEIGELPPMLQTALLGALERGSFRRVGGQTPIKVDVRVICATNRDLRAEVNQGTFRQDLYYRIAVVLLRVPPLRERAADIPLLVEHFLRSAGYGGDPDAIVPEQVMDALVRHRWPGNVRELRNFVEAALAMGEAPSLEPTGDLPSTPVAPSVAAAVSKDSFPSVPIEQLLRAKYKDARAKVLEDFDRRYLTALLERCDDNVSRAARESEIHRSYLNEMLKRHRLR